MSVSKIVKRYANRKLYDTERSCYVTLEDIALMIRAGDVVKVIDNRSGQDLTAVTLAQIIFELEKKHSFMPLSLLQSLIRDSKASVQRLAQQGHETFASANDEAVPANDLQREVDHKPEQESAGAVPTSKPLE